MTFNIKTILKNIARLSTWLGSASLLAGLLLSLVRLPGAQAAGPERSLNGPAMTGNLQNAACTPPGDWGATTRLWDPAKPSKEWNFEVKEAEMDVTLEFFYFQDYDMDGCPLDCGTGGCQSDETGEGDTPLGGFAIGDGSQGANSGTERVSGRLKQGSYTASFHVTGKGSISVGLRVHRKAVPTSTPEPLPTATPTHTPTDLPTATPSPTPENTATRTPSGVPPTATPTSSGISPTATPSLTPLATATGTLPPASSTPTLSVTEVILPPSPTIAATETPATDEQPKPTKVPTLPPPGPRANVTPAAVLIPVAGADHSAAPAAPGRGLYLNLGIGLLGLGLCLYGLGFRPGKK